MRDLFSSRNSHPVPLRCFDRVPTFERICVLGMTATREFFTRLFLLLPNSTLLFFLLFLTSSLPGHLARDFVALLIFSLFNKSSLIHLPGH